MIAQILLSLLLSGIVVFWLCRLVIQFLVYEADIWRGRPFYTLMHVAFSLLWIYIVMTYGVALRSVCVTAGLGQG